MPERILPAGTDYKVHSFYGVNITNRTPLSINAGWTAHNISTVMHSEATSCYSLQWCSIRINISSTLLLSQQGPNWCVFVRGCVLVCVALSIVVIAPRSSFFFPYHLWIISTIPLHQCRAWTTCPFNGCLVRGQPGRGQQTTSQRRLQSDATAF